ncbi:hypothetical protein ACS0TY_017788 [Phlomoides rotata]
MEGDEASNGWPLGLGNMRVRAADAPQAAAPPQPYAARSSSFSSFSSSNLDTESIESFFPDQSVSLGHLIGIKPITKGSFYDCRQQHHLQRISDGRFHPNSQENKEISQGLCVPLLHHIMGKMGKTGSYKKQ